MGLPYWANMEQHDESPYRMLPHGGVYVDTIAGPVQFGAPPETIKDSLGLGLEVPSVFVLSSVLFDRERGLNVAEIEFPAYYNFFVQGRRTRVLVDSQEVEERIRRVFQETLFGPRSAAFSEFAPDYPVDCRPDFRAESDHFRILPDGSRLEVDHLLEFLHFDDEGVARVFDQVEVQQQPGGRYLLRQNGEDLISTPRQVMLPDRASDPAKPGEESFVPPEFGITVLGSSHGFDPKGKTTGFILWIGKRGLLVDPPADTSSYLRSKNVASKLIEGVVITHCHADHDGGAFQKILAEGRVDVYTTPTIMASFLRKYSALSGIESDVLRRTFRFRPVTIGAPTLFNGGELRFFYTLHSIPTIGFEAFYGGRSLAFSGDSLFDPLRIQAMESKGILSSGRAAKLLDFPWHHTVVLHEAGVPPLHTPAKVLAALPAKIRESLYVVHIAEADIPEGLQPGPVGLSKTISIDVEAPEHADAAAIIDAFCSVDLFREFPIEKAREVLRLARRVQFSAGAVVCTEGESGDAFFIVEHGTLAVVQKGYEFKRYHTGDYFGETSLVLDQPRNADVVAKTDVSLIRIERHAFLYLVRGTEIASRMVKLARVRAEHSWQLFGDNSVLAGLTSAQKTNLQTRLSLRELEAGTELWSHGEPADSAFIIDAGTVVIEGTSRMPEPFSRGAFVGDVDALREDQPHATTARAMDDVRVYVISRADLVEFFEQNPGVMLSFLGARFVE